jgi:polyisoprenyl-teichoic acid--peptidoglycan teichoic acid transferase
MTKVDSEAMVRELITPAPTRAARSKGRLARRIMVALFCLLLMLVIGAFAYVAFLNHTMTTNIKHAALLPAPVAGEKLPVRQAAAKNAQNILLVGSDSRGALADGRSDVMVLVHVSSDRKKVYLIHFPRDMYVDVPGHGKDKINAAYAYGGPPLLVRTLEKLVDVRLDHVAVIGFDGFSAMTDAVGGVDVYAEEASSEPGFGTVHVGWNHLGGGAALGFVRERHQLSDGDISRGRRQQAFLKALALKSLSRQTLTNPVRAAELLGAATGNLTVDNAFSVAEMRSDALSISGLRSKDIVFITAPITGFGTTPQGASIDIVDNAKMAQLSSALKNDNMSKIALGQQIP